LAIAELELPRRLTETLDKWGVHTVGDLARLPADRIAARLGSAGEAAHRTARGEDPEPLVPHHPQPVLREGLELEWPVFTVEPLLAALRQSLERIHHRLEYQDMACTLLELELAIEPDGADRRLIRLPAPARDVEALLALIRLEIEARPPRGPVAAFLCIVHPDRPRTAQLTLFGPPEIRPERLAVTLARLAARLGPDRVGSPRMVDSHLPENAGNESFDPPPAPTSRRTPRAGRGLLAVRVLRPPVPLEVIFEGVQPVSVASENGAKPHIQGLVRVAAGPWGLEEGWWKDEPVGREYWDVELSGGGLYRIYRDTNSENWFADGLYD
jgi:protein ImuB